MRQAERQQGPKSSPRRKLLIGVLILAAFIAAASLGYRSRHSRYDAFAKCLTEKKAVMYGLYWCPHCKDQEEMFGSSFKYVSYVECGKKGGGEQPNCVAAGVKHFPTWQFADGERREGALPLQILSAKTGCSLP